MKSDIILIASEAWNGGYTRTPYIFPSADAARSFIKNEMGCNEEELLLAKKDTPSPHCECYSFEEGEYIFHIYTHPIYPTPPPSKDEHSFSVSDEEILKFFK